MHDDKVKAALDAMRARCEAATPGPWGYKAGVLKHYAFSLDAGEDFGVSLQELHWQDGREVPAAANAQFIAAARTDVPKLLAVAEAALAARKRDHAERRWLIVSGRLGDDADHFADDWLAEDAALDAALAALAEP